MLIGARIDKISAPMQGLTSFLLHRHDFKSNLFLHSQHIHPFLFLSTTKIQNPPIPPAYVMRLRKHCCGRRIIKAVAKWDERRLMLTLSPWIGSEFSVISLDLKEGPILMEHSPHVSEPLWPEHFSNDLDWKDFPVLTPDLRRTMNCLSPLDQDALFEDLKLGGGDVFLYFDKDGIIESVYPWPLPKNGDYRIEKICESAIDATRMYAEKIILPQIFLDASKRLLKRKNSEIKKINKILEKTRHDRERLQNMIACKKIALAIQAELYRFPNDLKTSKIKIDGFSESVNLNPSKTIVENMQFLFKQAERGARGIEILESRVRELCETKSAIERSLEEMAKPETVLSMNPIRKNRKQASKFPKTIQFFKSKDGFLILRGKDASGNLALLKMSSPNDIWMHAGGVAGAHVAIRLQHSQQEIPKDTLYQAGLLAIEKSERKFDSSADAIYSRMKYIKPIKGSKTGAVHISQLIGSILVTPSKIEHPEVFENDVIE